MAGNAFRPTLFRFTQATASATWNIAHNLGNNGSAGIPIVDVFIDVDGETQKVIANVVMNDKNNVTVSFAAPQTGYAIVIV